MKSAASRLSIAGIVLALGLSVPTSWQIAEADANSFMALPTSLSKTTIRNDSVIESFPKIVHRDFERLRVKNWQKDYCYVGNDLDFFANDISQIGDINSDGFPDILAGTDIQRGRYVILSGTDGTVLRDVTSPPFESQGAAVAAYGDYNGDAIADFLVGAPFADVPGKENAGVVRLFSGADGTLLKTFKGQAAHEMMGGDPDSIATIGDINDDGILDVAVGAPYADVGEVDNGGKIYLFSGATAAVIWTSTEGALFDDDNYGTVLDIVGDVDGDGMPDIITGTLSARHRYGGYCAAVGEVRMISGLDGTTIHLLTLTADNNGRVGRSVTGLGDDINADGYPDAAFGADWWDQSAGMTSHQIVLVSGFDGKVISVIDERQLNNYAGTYNYVFSQGFDLDEIADVDGDGLSDLIAGVPSFGIGDFGQGAIAVYSSASGGLLDVIVSDLPQSTIPREQLGWHIAGLSDINGDGGPDVVGGASFYTPRGGDSNGRICVFNLKAPKRRVDPPLRLRDPIFKKKAF